MEYARSEAKEAAREQCRGVWAAITVPFTEDKQLDEEGLRSNMRYFVEELKVDGVFCTGVMGEFWALSPDEWKRAIELTVEGADGGCRVIAHTGHHSAEQAVEMTLHAQDVGADFAIMVTPYFPARSPAGIYDWFRTVCDRVDIGVWIFDAIYAGNRLSPELLSDLADFENICGMKQPFDIDHHREIVRRCGDRMIVSQPHEDLWMQMMREFDQQVLMASPTPLLYQRPGSLGIRDYTALAQQGKWEEAEAVSARLAPYRKLRKQFWTEKASDGIMPMAYIKEWHSLLGIAAGPVRTPLLNLTPAEKEEFRAAFEAAGVLSEVEGAAVRSPATV